MQTCLGTACLHVDTTPNSVSVPDSVSASLERRSGNKVIQERRSGNKVMEDYRFRTHRPQGLRTANKEPQGQAGIAWYPCVPMHGQTCSHMAVRGHA